MSECKLVIAHLPLNDSPPLEGVPLLPTIDDKKRPTHFEFEMEDELAAKRSDFESKKAAGAGREVLNPIGYHIAWLEKFVKLSATTSLPTFVEGEIWVARLGDVAVVGSPGELFTEIGYEVRKASPFKATIFAGYCQGVLGYISTRAEYPYGGYEPTVAQRGYGHPAPFAPEAGEMIAAESIALLNQLFKVNN